MRARGWLWLIAVCLGLGCLGRLGAALAFTGEFRQEANQLSLDEEVRQARARIKSVPRSTTNDPQPDLPVGSHKETAGTHAVHRPRAHWERSWLDSRETARDALREYGLAHLEQKLYGPWPVRPLGVAPGEWDSWCTDNPEAAERFRENHLSAIKRINDVNRATANPLAGGRFEVFAYAGSNVAGDDGSLEVIVGSEAEHLESAKHFLFEMVARKAGYDPNAAPPSLRAEFNAVRDTWRDKMENYRRTFWTLVYKVATRKLEQGLYERDVIVLYKAQGRLVLVRRGDELALEHLIDQLHQARRALNAEIRVASR